VEAGRGKKLKKALENKMKINFFFRHERQIKKGIIII
jgi:hypothetical protein